MWKCPCGYGRGQSSEGASEVAKKRVVILGGGFGGVSVAQRLEQIYSGDPSLEITLVEALASLSIFWRPDTGPGGYHTPRRKRSAWRDVRSRC